MNYTQLILGNDIKLSEKITIHIPTIEEMSQIDDDKFSLHVKPFVISVREFFSGAPTVVDKIEDQFPTFWEMAFEDQTNMQIGQMMGNDEIFSLRDLFIEGFAYWTNSDRQGFKALSNGKIINEELDWVIDKDEYVRFCDIISTITLSVPNEDLIAPRGMTPAQIKVWEQLYAGRVRKLKKAPKVELGDKILILQASANSYIPFEEIKKMTYYQFSNLIKAYAEKEAGDQQFSIYTSYKFDTEKMKLTDWRNNISLIKK